MLYSIIVLNFAFTLCFQQGQKCQCLEKIQADTINQLSNEKSNTILINGKTYSDSAFVISNDTDTNVKQTGKNNLVKIQTTKCCGKSKKSVIKVEQKGKNNSIKINSH